MNKLRTTARQGTEFRQTQPGRTGRGRLVFEEGCEIMIRKVERNPKRRDVIEDEGGISRERYGSTVLLTVDKSW